MFKLTITLATGERITRTFTSLHAMESARAEILASEGEDVAFCEARRA